MEFLNNNSVGLIIVAILLGALFLLVKSASKKSNRVFEKAPDPVEFKNAKQPKKWTRNEIILLAHIVLYYNPDDAELIKELSSKIKRSPSSIKRKFARLYYYETQSSALDKEVLKSLKNLGLVHSQYAFNEASMILNGSTAWFKKYVEK